MKTNLSKIICVLISLVVVLSLSGCSGSKGFTATADATWGELCRHFDLKWFNSHSKEMQSTYNSILLNESPKKKRPEGTETISSSTPVYSDTKESRYTVYEIDTSMLYESDTEIPADIMHLELLVGENANSLDYVVAVNSLHKYESLEFVAAVSICNKETNEYIAFGTLSSTDGEGWQLVDSFVNLESNNKYIVQAIAIVEPPEGYTSSGPLYVEKEVTTIEPTNTTK